MGSFHLHMRLRSTPKHVECDVCDKLLKNYSVMVVHKRMHFGERPYKCMDCDERMICSSHLKTHHQMHKQLKLSIYANSGCGDDLSFSDKNSSNLKNVNQWKTYTGKDSRYRFNLFHIAKLCYLSYLHFVSFYLKFM